MRHPRDALSPPPTDGSGALAFGVLSAPHPPPQRTPAVGASRQQFTDMKEEMDHKFSLQTAENRRLQNNVRVARVRAQAGLDERAPRNLRVVSGHRASRLSRARAHAHPDETLPHRRGCLVHAATPPVRSLQRSRSKLSHRRFASFPRRLRSVLTFFCPARRASVALVLYNLSPPDLQP